VNDVKNITKRCFLCIVA